MNVGVRLNAFLIKRIVAAIVLLRSFILGQNCKEF